MKLFEGKKIADFIAIFFSFSLFVYVRELDYVGLLGSVFLFFIFWWVFYSVFKSMRKVWIISKIREELDSSLYFTSRQVSFDLGMGKRVLLEYLVGGKSFKAILKINDKGKLILEVKGNQVFVDKSYVFGEGKDGIYTFGVKNMEKTIIALLSVCNDLGIKVVKDSFLEYLDCNGYWDVYFR
jgi:hypothetical protein